MREHELRREGERLVKDAAPVARQHFLAVDEEIGERDDVRLRFLVEVALIERHHAVDTSQEHFTFPAYIDSFLVDRGQGKAGRAVVVAERVTSLVEYREAAIRDEQQFIIVKRGRHRRVDAVALQAFRLPVGTEAVLCLNVLLNSVARSGKPNGSLPVNRDVGDIVVGQLSFSLLLHKLSDGSGSQVIAPHAPALRSYPEASAVVEAKGGDGTGEAFAPEQRPEHVLTLRVGIHQTDAALGAYNQFPSPRDDVTKYV